MIRQGWYINLDRSTDRRARMEAECARLDFPVERFTAYEPETIPPAIAARFPPDTDLTPPGRACFASHLGLLERAAATPEGYCLVLEDDATLHGDFASISHDLADWPDAPEVIRLENPLKCPAIRVRAGERYAYVRPLRIPNSSAGYLVTPAGARRILDLAWDLNLPPDRFLRKIGRSDVDMLVCAPPPLSPIDQDTTIGAVMTAGARRAPGFRNSGFSPRREWRYAASFGWVNFSRLLLAQIKMRWAGVKLDIEGKYILSARPGLARS